MRIRTLAYSRYRRPWNAGDGTRAGSPKASPGVGHRFQDCDIRDAGAIAAVLRARRPELVVHLAAYTNVDGCEANPQIAEETNSLGTRNIATACAEIGAAMLYVSTDYVFDGLKTGAYGEDDPPNPLSVYGRSKLMGEQHVRAILKRYFIVRTSWLYGPNGKNFVTTILKVAHRQKVLRVVNDQHGSPTYTRHLSLKIAELLRSPGLRRLPHDGIRGVFMV